MANKTEYYIHGVNGPVVKVRGGRTLPRMSLVYVGNQRLFGEVVSSAGEESIVQIYEDSGGLSAGEPVYPTNEPMSVRLGPGLIGGIFDGIGRPLQAIEERAGSFISKGINIESLDEEKLWDVEVLIKEGDELKPGEFFARCRESEMTEHRSMVPPRVSGRAVDVKPSGSYTVVEPIAYVDDGRGNRTPLTLSQRWQRMCAPSAPKAADGARCARAWSTRTATTDTTARVRLRQTTRGCSPPSFWGETISPARSQSACRAAGIRTATQEMSDA